MDQQAPATTCQCHPVPPVAAAKKTIRSMPSAALGIVIAFFPKCPFCWAAYMSMFGSIGLARLPYLPWLFPVLLGFLGLHLLLLLRRAPQKGYGPFVVSLAGALLLLGSRGVLPAGQWLPLAGMALILAGSLWNSFAPRRNLWKI